MGISCIFPSGPIGRDGCSDNYLGAFIVIMSEPVEIIGYSIFNRHK